MQRVRYALIVVPTLLVPHGLAHAGPIVDDPPSIVLTAEIAGPPRQIVITVQDSDSTGLENIVVDLADNATVVVPSFSSGTTSPVTVTATEIDQTIAADVELRATDIAGLATTGSFEFGPVSVPEPSTAANLGASLAALAFAAAMCSRCGFRRSRSQCLNLNRNGCILS